MELSQLFTVLVLGICATHVIWKASAKIDAWWNRLHQSGSQAAAASAKPVQERGDWYVFFHCSDLLGPDPAPKKPVESAEKTVRPQRRQTAQRA